MSSLARRSLRATAAVAGIAAAGVGLAGPALAAPTAPERSSTDGVAPAAPDAGTGPNVVDALPPAPKEAELPPLFTIERPGVHTSDHTADHTADHARPTPPAADQLPSADDAVNVDNRNTDAEFRSTQEQDSALQQLDAASMFRDVSDPALRGAESNDARA
jgi:hypothetical protein